MKKILLGLIVIAMVLALTACSQDQYEKLGEMMGGMSGNIYGIEANLKDVENATNKVDGAVVQIGDEITVKLEADTAKSIVNSVVAVKNSDTKKEALKASLSEPLLGKGTSDATWASLKIEIAAQATSNKISDEEKASYSAERAEIATAVNDALSAVGASLSAKPTKAELATVAVLTTLAEAVKSGDEESYKAAGKAAVDALKITSEIGQVDVFANADISSLLSKLSEKSIARDGEEEEIDLFGPLFESSVSEIVACITEDGKFVEQRYNKFVMESMAMRASYEMIAKGYDIDVATPLKGQATVDAGLVIEDLGHYIISVVFSSIDTYATDAADFLEDFINGDGENEGYYAQLIDFDLDNLPDFSEGDFAADGGFIDSVIAEMAGEDLDDYDLEEVIKEIIRDENTEVGGKVASVLQTIGVILLDSEYESLLSQIKAASGEAEEGSLRCFLYVF